MNAWGYVFLAYGIVWFALLIYLVLLNRRVRKVEAELSDLHPSEDLSKNA
ncbi:MAG: CcmD family protein [Deltaproteobacteria bacterium]|nr:CcmD family protein [Deltaproteobacteria bacterium]